MYRFIALIFTVGVLVWALGDGPSVAHPVVLVAMLAATMCLLASLVDE